MYCPNCGKELDDRNIFCSYCGSKIDDGGDDNRNSVPSIAISQRNNSYLIIIISVVVLLVIVAILIAVNLGQNSSIRTEDDYSQGYSNTYSSGSGSSSSSKYSASSFTIEGKWKSVGSEGFGQAQPGSIVSFNGTNCNFFSPSDTYAFYKSGSSYVLDVTSVLTSKNLTFTVKIIDNDNIEVTGSGRTTTLKRMN